MTLTVEDGTGLADADAIMSVATCTAFCAGQGLTDWTGATRSPPEDDEAAIRRATTWLWTSFTYKGSRTNGRSQAGAFPRTGCTDDEGSEIASDEIPPELVQACCVAAAFERGTPGGLSPNVVLTDRIRREKVGVIETEYAAMPISAEANRPVLLLVQDMIAGLLATSSNSLVGTAVRG